MEKRVITKKSLTADLINQHFTAKEFGTATVYSKPDYNIQLVIKDEKFSIEDKKGEQIFTTRFDINE